VSDQPRAAEVQTLTAEVKALMIGNRQVTLSVYRQLDEVEPDEMEPFGRVRDSRDSEYAVSAVGRHRTTGALVRASRRFNPKFGPDEWNAPRSLRNHGGLAGLRSAWAVVGPSNEGWEWDFKAGVHRLGDRELTSEQYAELPNAPWFGTIGERSPYAVNLVFSTTPLTDNAIKPGGWDYADPDTRSHLKAAAERWLDDIHAHVEQWERWRSQPLIVLAGLR
jgi:hypothetical protein